MNKTERSGLASFINELEETFIALLLGLMTVITFANVVARYVFDSNILWALEATVFLFAWLVLIGVSYCVKHSLHLGVDVITAAVSPQKRHVLALIAAVCALLFCGLLLKGSWEYWLPFASKNAWYEVNDIPMPDFLQFIAGWLNEGERYEKMPKFIPYFALPLGISLLTLRMLQAAWAIVRGENDTLIASHEADDELSDLIDRKVDDLDADLADRSRSSNKEA